MRRPAVTLCKAVDVSREKSLGKFDTPGPQGYAFSGSDPDEAAIQPATRSAMKSDVLDGYAEFASLLEAVDALVAARAKEGK